MIKQIVLTFEFPDVLLSRDGTMAMLRDLIDQSFKVLNNEFGVDQWCSEVRPSIIREAGTRGGAIKVKVIANSSEMAKRAEEVFTKVWQNVKLKA